MKKIVENTSKYLAMSKEENKEFLDNLYSLMKKIRSRCSRLSRSENTQCPPLCPDCQSNHIIKNGLQMGCKTIVAKIAADSLELPQVLLFTGCKRKKKCSITSDVW
ncbi:MAG: hypothetical protein IPH17_07875 [Bacteroidales bacterium]|nr:hypothetical protein [Bacteroidales bacterium]